MYVYKTAEGINTGTPVFPRFQTAEPQDAAQDPVTIGVAGRKFRAVYLAGGPTGTENGVGREPGTNHGAYIVLTSRCATTAILLAHAIKRGGNRIANDNAPAGIEQRKALAIQAYVN
jgi:hypothetical protein